MELFVRHWTGNRIGIRRARMRTDLPGRQPIKGAGQLPGFRAKAISLCQGSRARIRPIRRRGCRAFLLRSSGNSETDRLCGECGVPVTRTGPAYSTFCSRIRSELPDLSERSMYTLKVPEPAQSSIQEVDVSIGISDSASPSTPNDDTSCPC